MKKARLLIIAIAAVLGLSISTWAGSPITVKADIPFPFYVDKEALPAGQYLFSMRPVSGSAATGTALLVSNPSGSISTMILSSPGGGYDLRGDYIYFNRYGKQYFLTRVEGLGFQANLSPTKLEKEARVAAGPAVETTVVAGK